jgi:PBP1b-binding outer membrane lipoprotein LpoB
MKRMRLTIAILLALAMILGACQGSQKPAQTQAPATEETTLVVWDQFYRDVRAR